MSFETITYKEGIISFLDILGFQRILDTEPPQMIHDLLNTFHEATLSGPDSMTNGYSQLYNINILSDCIFKTVDMTNHIEDKCGALILMQEIIFNIISQGTLFSKYGKFVRGAMTFGKFFARDDQRITFGPGIARSYTLESKYAFYPRIYIDPYVIEIFNTRLLPRYLAEEGDSETNKKHGFVDNFYGWLEKGDDGMWFLDYLGHFPVWVPHNEAPSLFIKKHKEAIESVLNARTQEHNDSTRLKYMWLANYHNKTINKWADRKWRKDLSKVTPKELLVRIPKNLQ